MPGIGVGAGIKHFRSVPGGGAPVPHVLTAPTLTGRAIVGQRVFVNAAGTYDQVPTSVTMQWQLEDGTILPEVGDNHFCDTIEQGLKVKLVEVATFPGGSLMNASALSAAIAARTLGAVQLVRTSALAAAPLVYTVTLPADCYPGDVLRAIVATDTTFNTISQLVALNLTADLIATPANIPAALTALGLADPGGTDVMQVVLETSLPNDTVIANTSATIGKNYVPVVVFDNFDDGIVDPTKWGADGSFTPEAINGATIAEANARLEVYPPDGAAGHIARISLNAATFVGKSIIAQRLNTNKSAGDEYYMRVGPDANNGYGIRIAGGTVTLRGFNAGAVDAIDSSVVDPDYNTGGIAPTTYGWFKLKHDNSDDTIRIFTAPPTAAKPPGAGEWTQRLSVARSNLYWNKGTTPNCYAAIGGGQWPGYPAEFINTIEWDNFDTDMAI